MNYELNEEQKMVKKTAHKLADEVFRPLAARWDENEVPPLPNLKVLAENGLAGITIPVEYEGSGGGIFDAVLVVEEIARVCTVTSAMVLGNCSNSEIILKFGTEELRKKYLPPVAKGETLIAWGMTEPEAGSAATDLKTRAELRDGYYILNGTKVFITRASASNIFIIFARIGNEPGAKGICSFVVERGTPGFTVGKAEKLMGLRGGGSCELILEDCKVQKRQFDHPPGDVW